MLLLVLVALAPPTAIAVVVAFDERDEAREHAQQDVLHTARVAAADVRRVMTGTAAFLVPLSRTLAEQPGQSRCRRLLALVPRSTDRYSSAGVARRDGSVDCGATSEGPVQPSERVEVSDAPWFREALASGRFVLGDLGTDPLSGTRALVAAQPIPAMRGRPRSVLFAAVDATSLAAGTALTDAPRGTSFLLFDQRGTIIVRMPPREGAVGARINRLWLAQTVLRRRQGTAEVEGNDGVMRIQGFTPVGGPGGDRLFVAAGRASESVFAGPTDDLRRFLLLALLGTLLALGAQLSRHEVPPAALDLGRRRLRAPLRRG